MFKIGGGGNIHFWFLQEMLYLKKIPIPKMSNIILFYIWVIFKSNISYIPPITPHQPSAAFSTSSFVDKLVYFFYGKGTGEFSSQTLILTLTNFSNSYIFATWYCKYIKLTKHIKGEHRQIKKKYLFLNI